MNSQVKTRAYYLLHPRGMVVYDDYGFPTCEGITIYVEEQMGGDDRLVVHNLNGHAVIVKR